MRRTLRKEQVDWFEQPAEVIDILTDEPPPDDLTKAVYVFAFEGSDLLLAKKRGEEQWALPGGERRSGETPEEAARRLVNEASGCELGTVQRLGWQQVRFADKVPADWTFGPDSYIRLYVSDIAGATGLQAANRRFFPPVAARAEPSIQDNHLLYEEALLTALASIEQQSKRKKRGR
ncbi:MAG: 8-oxo-dGTP diphosphatase [Actinomycetota bacterium]|jgi:ADP-ribose pyrophosphatase YjhB (NUDIX family)